MLTCETVAPCAACGGVGRPIRWLCCGSPVALADGSARCCGKPGTTVEPPCDACQGRGVVACPSGAFRKEPDGSWVCLGCGAVQAFAGRLAGMGAG